MALLLLLLLLLRSNLVAGRCSLLALAASAFRFSHSPLVAAALRRQGQALCA